MATSTNENLIAEAMELHRQIKNYYRDVDANPLMLAFMLCFLDRPSVTDVNARRDVLQAACLYIWGESNADAIVSACNRMGDRVWDDDTFDEATRGSVRNSSAEKYLLYLYMSPWTFVRSPARSSLEKTYLLLKRIAADDTHFWFEQGAKASTGILTYLPTYLEYQRGIIRLIKSKSGTQGIKPTIRIRQAAFEKPVNIQNSTQLLSQVTDVEVFGDPDTWKLICKASSKSQNWMKSTKATEIEGVGCLVQVTTQTASGVAEAITLVPNVVIQDVFGEDGVTVIRRRLVRSPTLSPRYMFNHVGAVPPNVSPQFQPNPVEETSPPGHLPPQSGPVNWIARLIRREIFNGNVIDNDYANILGISHSDLSQLATGQFTISLTPMRGEPHVRR